MTAAATSPSSSAPAASSASEDIPASSAFQPIASPCAAAIPTRIPVKLPGPTPTRMCAAARPSSNSASIGTSRSLWPPPICSSLRARHAPASLNRAAVQAALDVSNARIMGQLWSHAAASRNPQVKPKLYGLYSFDLRDVMADQALDPALQGHGRRRAARTGAVHREVQMAVLVPLVNDVAAVLRDRRADAGLDQLLDLVDDIGVGRVFLD